MDCAYDCHGLWCEEAVTRIALAMSRQQAVQENRRPPLEIRSIDSFLPYYEGVRERTRRVVACIPDEHMEWRHAPGRFSFGDLVRHVAAL
jgi:hypothetical protein